MMIRVLAVLLVAGACSGQTYGVGDSIVEAFDWNYTAQPDTLISSDQVVGLSDVGAFSIPMLEAVTDDECEIWLYEVRTGSAVVTAVYGPQYLRDWFGARALTLPGRRISAFEVIGLSGAECLVHARGR
jgi:hypothetical protein